MTGLFAEHYRGLGFSETAFRIFVLMASRRLKSDRFFTDDWKPEIIRNWGWTGSTQLAADHPSAALSAARAALAGVKKGSGRGSR